MGEVMKFADTPEWLLPRLTVSDTSPNSERDSRPAPRIAFPPAAPEIIEQARDALDAHGPAIEGQGGDLHTWRACALLMHDFALSEDEAWPLLAEWNDTCEPHWDEEDLRAKLRSGEKYGRAEYGCKRPFNPVELIKAEIQKRIASPDADEVGMLERVKMLHERASAAQRVIIERELEGAGFNPRKLKLSKKQAPQSPPPEGAYVLKGGGRAQAIQDADEVLGGSETVFQRNGMLMRIAKVKDAKARDEKLVKRDPESLVLRPMDSNQILNALAVKKWVRLDQRNGEWVTTDFPPSYAGGVEAAGEWERVRPLAAIIGAPTLDLNMDVISTPGYHKSTGLLLTTSTSFEPIKDRPTKDDGVAALERLREPFDEFSWVSPAAESAHMAAILTAGIRHLFSTAPAIAYDAPTRGSGKSLLGDSIGGIWHGTAPAHVNYGQGGEEFRKLIAALLVSGDREILIDNVDRPLRSPELCNALTTARYSDRRLGFTERLVLDARVIWIINGNNLIIVGDLGRRVLFVSIDPEQERPENRTFRIPHLLPHIIQHRGKLAPAALTVLKAFALANPPQQATPLGSFEAWSRMVREPLIWLGMADPCVTTDQLNEVEPEKQTLSVTLTAWREAFGSDCKTAPEVVNDAVLFAHRSLKDALAVALGSEREISARAVGNYLRRWKGVIADGMRFVADTKKGHAGYIRWRVQVKGESASW